MGEILISIYLTIKKYLPVIVKNLNALKCIANATLKVFYCFIQEINVERLANALDAKIQKT